MTPVHLLKESRNAAVGYLVVVAAFIVVCVIAEYTAAVAAARVAAVAGFIWVSALLLSRADRTTYLNPAAFVAMQAILLYSAVFWLSLLLADAQWRSDAHRRFLGGYFGGVSELLVLVSGVVCLLVAIVPQYWKRPFQRAGALPYESARLCWGLCAAGAVAIAAYYTLESHHPAVMAFAVAGMGREIHNLLTPLIGFCLAAAVYCAAVLNKKFKLALLCIIGFSMWAMMEAMQATVPIFMLLGLLALWLAMGTYSWRRLAFMAICFVVTIGCIVALKTEIVNRDRPTNSSVSISEIFISKFVDRQMASAGCLDKVVSRAFSTPSEGSPIYFLAGPVPRVLWPGKPNLSRGSEFAEDFCGIARARQNSHSESITLLGEPLIEAGVTGLLLAAAVFLGILLAAQRLVCTQSMVGPIIVAALFPWLSAFQQHYALYLANLVKSFVIIAPFVALLLVWEWQRRRRPDEKT